MCIETKHFQALLKFAQIVYVINDLLGDKALAQAGLVKLKAAFSVFARNQQKYPLVYESMFLHPRESNNEANLLSRCLGWCCFQRDIRNR